MIKKCNDSDSISIYEYIGNDYEKCLYLYLDYKKYGFKNKNVNFYFQYDSSNTISALVLVYFKSMHIFTKKNNIEYNELIEFIIDKDPKIICSEKEVIENLANYLTKYKSQYGFVRKMNDFNFDVDREVINIATKEDLIQVAKLISDDIGLSGGLSYDEIYNQLLERYESGYCRNFVFKRNEKIVAHVCSGAESDSICILTDLIVDKNYRGQGFAKKICKSFCKKMYSEDKIVYLINYTIESNILYEKLGFAVCCEWGKLYKK